MKFDAKWEDLNQVHSRMSALQLFDGGWRPDTIAGHILTAGTVARAQKRSGQYRGADALIREYCDWKHLNYKQLINGYYAIRRKRWGIWQSLEELIEELSRD